MAIITYKFSVIYLLFGAPFVMLYTQKWAIKWLIALWWMCLLLFFTVNKYKNEILFKHFILCV